MKLEIKNDRQIEAGGGTAWSADLYVDGVKAAVAEDDGDGGCTNVVWVRPDLKDAVQAFANSNPIRLKVFGDELLVLDGEGPEWDGGYIMGLAELKAEVRVLQ